MRRREFISAIAVATSENAGPRSKSERVTPDMPTDVDWTTQCQWRVSAVGNCIKLPRAA